MVKIKSGSIASKISSIFTKKKEGVKTESVNPSTASVNVTDFSSGESVTTKTETSPTGVSTTTRTARGKGGSAVSPEREQFLIQQSTQPSTQPASFSGKVDVSSAKGITEQTLYYLKGRETGRIDYNPKRVGGMRGVEGNKIDVYDVSKDNATPTTTQPSRFNFNRGGRNEQVEFTRQEVGEGRQKQIISIARTTITEETPQALSQSNINMQSQRDFSNVVSNISQGARFKPMGLDLSGSFNKTKTFGNIVLTNLKKSETYGDLFTNLKSDIVTNYPNVIGRTSNWYSKTKIPNLITDLKKLSYKIDVGRLKISGLAVNEENLLVRKEQDIIAGKDVNFLLLGAFFTPAGIGNQVFKTTIPLRQRTPSTSAETIRTDVIAGKPFRYSDYVIYTEKAPPRISYTTSLNREAMGKLPKDIKYLNPIISRTKTPFKATANDPFVVLESKGGISGTASIVSGSSKRLDILNYNQLPKNEQFLVQRLAEAKTGVPSSNKYLGSILKKDKMRFISDINIEKAMKINIKPKSKIINGRFVKDRYNLFPEGKRTNSYQAITEITPIRETELLELTSSRVLFKDVSKPFSRATGKTPELKIVSLEYKEPNIISLGDNGVNVIRPSGNVIKTPLDKTFQRTIQVQKQPTLFAPPKTPRATQRTTIISQPKQSSSQISSSLYAGKGMYERTEGGRLPSQSFQRSVDINAVRNLNINSLQPAFRTFEIESTKNIFKNPQREISQGRTITSEKNITKEIAKELSKTTQRTSQKTLLKQSQKRVSRVPPFIPTRNPTRNPPKNPPRKLIWFGKSQGLRKGGLFNVFVRRRGKFKQIGGGLSLNNAFGLGQQSTQFGLGQTFKVRNIFGNTPNQRTPKGYYPKYSKKEGIVFIEKPKSKINTAREKSLLSLSRFSKIGKGGRRKRLFEF